jgi:voltage-gated potassium channel
MFLRDDRRRRAAISKAPNALGRCIAGPSARRRVQEQERGNVMAQSPNSAIRRERWRALSGLERWLRTPMLALSFIWLVLVLSELAFGDSPLLGGLGTAIWIIFGAEFALRITLAPDKLLFLRRNWLTAIALLAPALRLFAGLRFLRLARGLRGLRLVRIVGTANRTMNSLRASMRRRGLRYVVGLTLLVALLGAGGMLAFEPAAEVQGGFRDYADALWWTAMLLTSIGSQFWPATPEGRILAFLIAVYGFAVFGYITASFASFFVGRDAASNKAEIAGAQDLAALRQEIAGLRRALASRGDEDRPV